MSSAATTVLPPFPRFGNWRGAVANTDPNSTSSFEGQIRIPVSVTMTSVPIPGQAFFFQTENVTSQTASNKFARRGIGFLEGWAELESFNTLPTLQNAYIRVAEDLAAASSMARFADAVLVTVTAPRHLEVEKIEEVAGEFETPEWLDRVTSRIYQFSALPENWDSYGSSRISLAAVRRATRIAGLLADIASRGRVPLPRRPFVAPSNLGGVLFEIMGRDRELHIEVPAGSEEYGVLRVWRDAAGNEFEQEYNIAEPRLREVLSWVVQNS